MYSSKLRACFIAPCLGTGGGDALMAGLTRHAVNINWTGICLTNPLTLKQRLWADLSTSVPIHLVRQQQPFAHEGLNEHSTLQEAIAAVCKQSDIVITWCVPDIVQYTSLFDVPVIEYAQNTDKYAAKVVKSNEEGVHYKGACSKAAATVFDDTSDVRVIYNGIDPSRVTPRKGRLNQRRVWGINDDQKVILFMGRFVKEKHPYDLVRVLQSLPDNYIGIFCGDGYEQNNLYNVCKDFVPGRTAFVKPQYHVGDILAAADCFFLPSDFEGHPLALMEAMLAGLPTVYTDFEVMPELHEQFGSLGRMIPRNAPLDTIRDAIVQATTENDEQIALTSYARYVVWNNYTISSIAFEWENWLEACVTDWRQKKRLIPIHPTTPRKIMLSVED